MAKFKPLPPLEELKRLLSYDPETGVFVWASKPSRKTVIGSIAGSIDSSTGYRRIRVKDVMWYAHRIAWYMQTGEDPRAFTIDHINRDRSDNRICNLRLATRPQQNLNTAVHSDNTSGFRGVTFHKQNKRWQARLGINGKFKSLGLYDTKEEAAAVYREAAVAHYGEFADDLT